MGTFLERGIAWNRLKKGRPVRTSWGLHMLPVTFKRANFVTDSIKRDFNCIDAYTW